MARSPIARASARLGLGAMAAILAASPAWAIPLNEDGSINVGVRAYVNARVGTQAKQSTRPGDQPATCPTDPDTCNFGGTYPYSGAGNLIQNRYFLEVKWKHDLEKLFAEVLPESVTTFGYTMTYRGEYDGIYDFGPDAYSHNLESRQEIEQAIRQGATFNPGQLNTVDATLARVRNRLRSVASYRNRLFQAYLDYEQGPVFIRFGRQNLAWGETDIFRLLDNINPTDDYFGSFLIDLDERRVPLNMLRGSYSFGTVGPMDQAFFEGYLSLDNTVAFVPGGPSGSPWAPPLGPPTGQTLTNLNDNPVSISGLRGGGRFVGNVGDFTFTLASYVTILNTQAVRFRGAQPTDHGYAPGVSIITADQYGPRVWINGASMTTALPSLKSILRAEAAVFRDEALFRGPTETAFPGKGLTPEYVGNFLSPVLSGQFDTVSRKNTYNMAIGWDMNQYIRFLNPNQTFFFSTQFFYRHIFDHDPLQAVPVPEENNSTRVVPIVQDSFLQTLAVNTTYNVKAPFTEYTMQVSPQMGIFYDWQGMFVYQPSVRLVRDPWRVILDYSIIDSGVYRYQFGLVRDRDNVRLQVEYVL